MYFIDSSNVMNTSDCSIGTGLADSFFKISGQNADINNMLINMSKSKNCYVLYLKMYAFVLFLYINFLLLKYI